MKKLSSFLMKVGVIVFFLFGVLMVGINSQYAQDKAKKIVDVKKPQKEIQGIRKVSKRELAVVAFKQTIIPKEIIKGDHTASGISLRNRGGGVINLRGVPKDSRAIKAYLYWDILANSPEKNPIVSINGVSVKGALIGKGDDPCWSGSGVGYNFVYRAKVPLYLLYVGINGDYKIAGFQSTEGFGMSPWDSTSSPYLAEGATLVVFYFNCGSKYKTTYVYEAPVSGQMFYTNFSTTLTGFSAPKDRAKFTMVGADGQIGSGLNASYFITAEQSFFQFTQIAGPPAATPPPISNADSDWNGNDVEPLNQLWDTRTHIVPIQKGSTTAEVSYKAFGDCLVVVAFFLGL